MDRCDPSPEPAKVEAALVVRTDHPASREPPGVQTRLCSNANAVAADREDTSSFTNMFWR